MVLPWFFHAPLAVGPLTLSREESAHAAGSRRLRAGDGVVLTDGQGRTARAVVLDRDGGRLTVNVSEMKSTPPPPLGRLTLATALPKGKRQDYLFEKCAELGVGLIVVTNFKRSVAQAEPRRLAGWDRTCREALKQSRQAWLPRLAVCASPCDAIEQVEPGGIGLVASPGHDVPPIGRVLPRGPDATPIFAVVGPEGGLTDEEGRSLADAGFSRVSLGPSILRIETACVALACQIHALLLPE